MDTVIPSYYVTAKSEKPNAAAVGEKKKTPAGPTITLWFCTEACEKRPYIQKWWEC